MLLHQVMELVFYHPDVAADNAAYAADGLHVIFFRLKSFAGAQAVADMVFEAYLVFSCLDLLFTKVKAAVAQGIELPNQVEQGVHHFYRGIRPEIFAAVLYQVARGEYPGERLLFDADPWIGLVILQHDVVARLVLLDQVVFEQQCIVFRIHDNPPDIGNS